MSRIIIEAIYIEPNVCFECGAPATERHHIVPASLGGTKTIPLCGDCHAKIHDVDGNRRTRIAELTKAALDAKKARGETWTRNTDTTAARRASCRARANEKVVWLMESAVSKYIQSRMQQGWSFTQLLGDLLKMYEISPNVYCTRTGKPIGKGQLSVIMNFWRANTAVGEMSETGLLESAPEEYAKRRTIEGATSMQIVKELEVLWGQNPEKWCTKDGLKIDHLHVLEWLKNKPKEDSRKAIKTSARTQREKKQEWLLNSEACKYVRELFASYKTRYLLAPVKMSLFNQKYELSNGSKITHPAQWSVLIKDLGFSGIITGDEKKIKFLHEWAEASLNKSSEARIIEKIVHDEVVGYIIYPTSIEISLMELHSWIAFLRGLHNDKITNIYYDGGTQPSYTFVSKEIVNKIINDMTM